MERPISAVYFDNSRLSWISMLLNDMQIVVTLLTLLVSCTINRPAPKVQFLNAFEETTFLARLLTGLTTKLWSSIMKAPLSIILMLSCPCWHRIFQDFFGGNRRKFAISCHSDFSEIYWLLLTTLQCRSKQHHLGYHVVLSIFLGKIYYWMNIPYSIIPGRTFFQAWCMLNVAFQMIE